MWPFRRKDVEPEDDPIGNICRMLVEKPWEWTPGRSTDGSSSTLDHTTGFFIGWDRLGSSYINDRLRVFVGHASGAPSQYVSPSDSLRLYKATNANAAAKISRPRVKFDDDAKSLAKAVLEGDLEAARALADRIIEFCNDNGG